MPAPGVWEGQQLAALKDEIAARLRPVCRYASDDEFYSLVERIARVQWKYEHRHNGDVPRAGTAR